MRKPSDSVATRNGSLVNRIKDIKAEHPFWGYRRVWAYLRYIDGLIVNKKRVYSVLHPFCQARFKLKPYISEL